MTVNETVIALIRPKPTLDLVVREPAEAVAAAQAADHAPDGTGTLASYATEVAFPVKGTWENPAIGSARADIVLTAPKAEVPLMFARRQAAWKEQRRREAREGAQREARRPVYADRGLKFTDDRWEAVGCTPHWRDRQSHLPRCEDCQSRALAAEQLRMPTHPTARNRPARGRLAAGSPASVPDPGEPSTGGAGEHHPSCEARVLGGGGNAGRHEQRRRAAAARPGLRSHPRPLGTTPGWEVRWTGCSWTLPAGRRMRSTRAYRC